LGVKPICSNCKSEPAKYSVEWDEYGHPEWNTVLCEDCWSKTVDEIVENGWVMPALHLIEESNRVEIDVIKFLESTARILEGDGFEQSAHATRQLKKFVLWLRKKGVSSKELEQLIIESYPKGITFFENLSWVVDP